jgi:hypothetical protein
MMVLFLFLFILTIHGSEIPESAEYVVQFKDIQEDPLIYAKSHELKYLGPVGQLAGYHRFTLKDHGKKHWIRDPHSKVKWMERQIQRQQFTRYQKPTDPLFNDQWHLTTTSAKEVWDSDITGRGVYVGIVDDGLQHTHPDLKQNYRVDLSHDYNEGDNDPYPGPNDFHGTACAGVIGATSNNTHCGSGVAPNVNLVGIRLIAGPTSDYLEAMGLSHRDDILNIYSSSWGPQDDGTRLEGPGRLVREIFSKNSKKGSIYVWASGNGRHVGDSCSYDGYASSPYTIAVGALDHTSKQAYYSEGCPALLCVAPSSGNSKGITTVDRSEPGLGYSANSECTNTFGGTSSACPLVAGIIALALQQNKNLNWRDVQILIAKSSKIVDNADVGWSTNSRGYRHNERYGFGLIDAKTLVTMSKDWIKLPDQLGFSSGTIRVNLGLPGDGAPICVAHRFSGSKINFVEHVLLRVTARHSHRGQLRIRLKSPENIVSIFADAHPDPHPNYNGWLFSSVRHFGESSGDGDWHVCIEDVVNDQYSDGVFDFFELAIFGH